MCSPWDVLPVLTSTAPARPGMGQRARTNVIVVVITHKYMQALNDPGTEHFLAINGQLVLMVLSGTSGYRLLPAHH